MISTERLFLLKLQDTEGTPETTLVGTDVFEADPGSKIDPDPSKTPIKLVAGKRDQEATVIGRKLANVTLNAPMRPWGASGSRVTPDWVRALQCAGFEKTENNGYWILKPTSTVRKDCTVWMYSGDLRSSYSLLQKVGNVKFDFTINMDFSGDVISKIELTGMGRYDGAPSNATQPSVSRNRTAVPALTGCTMQIGGDSDYRVLSLTITGNQPTEATVLPTHASGVGINEITDTELKISCKAYREITTTADPEASLYNLTTGALRVWWDADNDVKIDGGYMQIIDVKPSDENGVETWDIEGILQRNDLTIRCLGGTSSSSSSSLSSSSSSSSSSSASS